MGQRHAEIAGAGFTGLTLGTALAQRGWTVRVHERAPEVRAFGAGIWIWENGIRILGAVGAADEAFAGCTQTPDWRTWDSEGRRIVSIAFSTESRVFCTPREQLLQAIHGAAKRAGVEIVTGSETIGATAAGELILADGSRNKADLVVGADGINSQVRDSLGLLKSRHQHVDGAMRMLVPHTEAEYDPQESIRVQEWWSGNRRLLYTPCNRDVFYICMTMLASDEDATAIPIRKEGWHRAFPNLRSIIDRLPDDVRYDRFQTTKLKAWSAGRVAILGDAAHSMSPGLGQGCGTSIVNAMALANMLDEADRIEDVLPRWETRQRPLAEHTQLWSKITWPLIPWPIWCAKAYYNFPIGAGWIARQRRRPSQHIAYGTEALPRWEPRGAVEAAAE
jgi:2-polyprenyl-6-methoxyphenol hydroxylase-like FAD-dependent oxidoreductase